MEAGTVCKKSIKMVLKNFFILISNYKQIHFLWIFSIKKLISYQNLLWSIVPKKNLFARYPFWRVYDKNCQDIFSLKFFISITEFSLQYWLC